MGKVFDRFPVAKERRIPKPQKSSASTWFPAMPSGAFAKMYTKFPGAERRGPPMGGKHFNFKWCCNSVDSGTMAKLHNKFPSATKWSSAPRPAAAADKKVLRQGVAETLAAAAEDDSLKRCVVDVAARCMEDVKSKMEGFRRSPSVGTWLLKKLPEPLVGAKSEDSGSNYTQMPSTGTRLAKPQPICQVPATKSFRFRPSVGSWLVRLPEDPFEEELGAAATKIQAIHRGKKARQAANVDKSSNVLGAKDNARVAACAVLQEANASGILSAELSKFAKARAFKRTPSVGTWWQPTPPVPACLRKAKIGGTGKWTPHPGASAAGGLILGLGFGAVYPSATCSGATRR